MVWGLGLYGIWWESARKGVGRTAVCGGEVVMQGRVSGGTEVSVCSVAHELRRIQRGIPGRSPRIPSSCSLALLQLPPCGQGACGGAFAAGPMQPTPHGLTHTSLPLAHHHSLLETCCIHNTPDDIPCLCTL